MSALHEAAASVLVESETGPLEAVVVHSPGAEIESMTPKTAQEVLYQEIIPLALVSDEHDRLKRFLSRVTVVHEFSDLLSAGLADRQTRETLVSALPPVCDREQFERMEPESLARTLIAGVENRGATLEAVLSGRQYELPPLPNLYFVRDTAVVIRDAVAIGAMASPVRERESRLVKAALRSAGGEPVFDGTVERPRIRLEGGDLLVARRDLLLAGVSSRTSAAALDALAAGLVARYREPLRLIVVVLPDDRSTIHLDTVFTLVDDQTAVLYEPLVGPGGRQPVYTMEIEPSRPARLSEQPDLPSALAAAGMPVRWVPCGGTDPVIREREQWLSAANVFAFAPGRVIAYDCNVATLEAFSREGFQIAGVEEFLQGRRTLDGCDRLVVAMPGVNLARGGGGPRCMTLPLRRAPAR